MRIKIFFLLFLFLALYRADTSCADVIWVEGEESCLAGLCYTDHLEKNPLILFAHSTPDTPDILKSVSAVVLCGPLQDDRPLPDVLRNKNVRVSSVLDEPKGEVALPDMPSAGAGHAYRLHIVFTIPSVTGKDKDRTSKARKGHIEIGGDSFALNRMSAVRSADLLILTRTLTLKDSVFSYSVVDAEFPLKRIVFEQMPIEGIDREPRPPALSVRRYSPSKYFVRVRKARDPFWLVLGERFHQHWRLYAVPKQDDILFENVSGTFPSYDVRESAVTALFDPRDLGYMFKRPLAARHIKVNSFANGWLIDPNQTRLPEDHDLVIFYWPQAFFYLGLLLSALVFASTVLFILLRPRSRR